MQLPAIIANGDYSVGYCIMPTICATILVALGAAKIGAKTLPS